MDLKRLRNVLIIWLALLVLLVFFSSLSQTGRDYSPIESTLVDGILPAFSVFTAIQTRLGSWWTKYLLFDETKKENERLKKQVSHLKMENLRFMEMASAHERLKKTLQIKSELAGPSLVAEVTGRSPNPFSQVFYINKGRKDGLVRGMPVLAPYGVVGRLEKTAEYNSQVLLIIDPGFGIDCLVQRSRVRGVLTGILGEKKCQIKYVARSEDIQPGDIIITSGLDRLFPKGLILGRVLRIDPKVKGNFLFIEVVPEVKLAVIEEVLIFQKKPPLPEQLEADDD